MEIFIEYEEKEYLAVKTVSVIGTFNDYDPQKGKMVKEKNKWIFKCNLPEGEHYYKFLINGELKLNDPLANVYLPDDNEELWSVIIINDKDQRLYNNVQYTTHIDTYNVTCNINKEENIVNKKDFNLLVDKKIVTRFQFSNVTGLHSVTTAWYTPKGKLFQIVENNLFTPEGEDDKPIIMWFWMDLLYNTHKQICGTWTIKLFIDGEFVLEDEVKLLEKNAYSSLGKMN